MEQTKQCPNCGKNLFHNKGISKKTNNPYENYKCGDKNCGYIEWIDLEQKEPEVKAFKKKAEANVEAQFIFDILEKIVELLGEINEAVKK